MGMARLNLQTFAAVALFGLLRCAESPRPAVQGKARGSAELDCNFHSFSPGDAPASLHVVEWVREGSDIPVLIKFGSHPPRVNPKFEGRVSLVRTTSLRLDALQLDDQGSYQCRILLLNDSADELQNGTWILLSVTAPPTFVDAPPPLLEALVGSHVSLSCCATGNPRPNITWSKDGSVIRRVNDKEALLSLGAVSMQSAGRYTCHASNTEGNVTRVTKVAIKGPPVIISHPKSISVNVSHDALLWCQAVADPPNMTYIWQKDGENVYHVESLKSRVKVMVDGTLLISNAAPGDSGNYTCTPTNGLLTPPTASANLTVMHPAMALQMPSKTYLPMGMEGVINCPVVAWPPLLHVDWTKDGKPLDLSLYPGWILTPEGSLFMTTVNEDTAGTYKCTPYNSYGTMGSSGSTNVILQDPPSFSITPQRLYKQEAGKTLLIPCQGKDEDPTIKVTWSKVDLLLRQTSYAIEPNGSLLLQPVTKDHQGWWECTATNLVATVRARTELFVLGTSPHAATSLSISSGTKQAHISWEAGFDGGSAQTFSVWVKKVLPSGNDKNGDWFSLPVNPPNGTSLQVMDLSPNTKYQFSVLARNDMGTGPFSEIATAWTLDLAPRKSLPPPPPASLWSRQSPAGVVLCWSLPDSQQLPMTAFVLQSRTGGGEWLNIDADIDGNSSEVLVPGLHKDCHYELRLLSRRGELLSEPSPSVNVSTEGMESYLPSRLPLVPDSLLAGVLGGVSFMCLALVLLLGSACLINHKRNRRHRQRENDPSPTMYNCSPSLKRSSTGSPDSMLKKSVLPAGVLYPTASSIGTTYPLSSSFGTDSSFVSGKTQQMKKNLNVSANHHDSAALSQAPSLIESISRGPDGRFMIPTFDSSAIIVSDYRQSSDWTSSDQRSPSLNLDEEDRKPPPFVLSVDLPPHSPAEAYPLLRQPMKYDPYTDDVSTCSRSSWATLSNHNRAKSLIFPTLPHIRSSMSQPSTTSSTLVLQMEHERERGNLSHCLKLAQEREELERELRKYTLERRIPVAGGMQSQRSEAGGYKLSGERRSNTLPRRDTLGKKASFGIPASPVSLSSHVSIPALVPVLDGTRARAAQSPCCLMSGADLSTSSSLNASLLQSEEIGRFTPLCPLEFEQHEKAKVATRELDYSPQSTLLEMQSSYSFKKKRLSHGSIPRLSFRDDRFAKKPNLPTVSLPDSSVDEPGIFELAGNVDYVEMSVDEPELEACLPQPSPGLMLHQRIASHLENGRPCTRLELRGNIRRATFNGCSSESLNDTIKVLLSPQFDRTKLASDVSQSWNSQSLKSRRQKESTFLTPDAWISSLSQENCSVLSSHDPDISTSVLQPSGSTISTLSPSPVAANLEVAGDACLDWVEEVNTTVLPHNTDQDVLEMEVGGSEGLPDSGGSHSSYASSGRGSMEQTGGCLSVCRLSPVLSSLPKTVERSLEDMVECRPHTKPSLRRKVSVDENYEWDAVDHCLRPAVEDNGLIPSLDPLKPAQFHNLPSMHCSTKTKAVTNDTRLSLLPEHHSGNSSEPEPCMMVI